MCNVQLTKADSKEKEYHIEHVKSIRRLLNGRKLEFCAEKGNLRKKSKMSMPIWMFRSNMKVRKVDIKLYTLVKLNNKRISLFFASNVCADFYFAMFVLVKFL